MVGKGDDCRIGKLIPGDGEMGVGKSTPTMEYLSRICQGSRSHFDVDGGFFFSFSSHQQNNRPFFWLCPISRILIWHADLGFAGRRAGLGR